MKYNKIDVLISVTVVFLPIHQNQRQKISGIPGVACVKKHVNLLNPTFQYSYLRRIVVRPKTDKIVLTGRDF
jgi:hypothetical protein